MYPLQKMFNYASKNTSVNTTIYFVILVFCHTKRNHIITFCKYCLTNAILYLVGGRVSKRRVTSNDSKLSSITLTFLVMHRPFRLIFKANLFSS